MLDFRLYTFLTLSETLNYTKAAEQLCITQPAVSQHIKYLENEYHVKLFHHNGKHLSLTRQGKVLAQSVRTMAADEKILKEKLKAVNTELDHLTFGATLTIGEFMLPKKLNTLLTRHPETSLTMIVKNTSSLLQMLDHGEISFAFVEGYFKKNKYSYQMISKEHFVALKHKDYPLTKDVNTLEDLLDETLILRESGSGTREILERVLKEKNLSSHDFRKTIEIGNMNAIKYLVQQKQGIAFLYETAAQSELSQGEFEIIPLQDFDIYREFNFITLKNSQFLQEYKDFLNDLLQEHEEDAIIG